MIEHRIPLLPGARGLAGRYRAFLCDVWGVLHNGVAAFPGAVETLTHLREGGGRVILVTNAPRPAAVIGRQLDGLSVPRAAYDGLVTSGDVTRDMLARIGATPVCHLGPARDLPLFEDLGLNLVAVEAAEVLLCTGLYDDTVETPADYDGLLAASAARDARMICANPDIMVERGAARVYCAGALAREYEKLGGEVAYAGKPHGPIYDLCLARLAALAGGEVARGEVLAIGDGLGTDIRGARDAGIDSLYVADGIHRDAVVAGDGTPDPARLDALFADEDRPPVAAVFGLSW